MTRLTWFSAAGRSAGGVIIACLACGVGLPLMRPSDPAAADNNECHTELLTYAVLQSRMAMHEEPRCALPGRCCSSRRLVGVMGAAAGEAASVMFSFPAFLIFVPTPLSAAALLSPPPGPGDATAVTHGGGPCCAASAPAWPGVTGGAGIGRVCCAALAAILCGAADSALSSCSAAPAAPEALAPPLRARIWPWPTALELAYSVKAPPHPSHHDKVQSTEAFR